MDQRLGFLLGFSFMSVVYLTTLILPRAARIRKQKSPVSQPSFVAAVTAVDETTRIFPASLSGAGDEFDNNWEVINSHLMGSTQGPRAGLYWGFCVLSSAYLSLFVVISVSSILEPGASLVVNGFILALTLLHGLLATVAVISACFDASSTSFAYSEVNMERTKRDQKDIFALVSIYYATTALALYFTFGLESTVHISISITATLLSATSLSAYWHIPLGRLQRKPVEGQGYRTKIGPQDLWSTNLSEQSKTCINSYHSALYSYVASKPLSAPPSLVYLLWLVHRRILAAQFCLVVGETMLYFSGAFFINRILESTPVVGKPEPVAFIYVGAMFVFSIVKVIVTNANSYIITKIEARIRNLLSVLIYEKSLRRDTAGTVSEPGKENASEGKIVNLVSVDANTVAEWAGYLYTPLTTGLQILISIAYLIYILGWSAIPGVVILGLLMFSGAPLASLLNSGYRAYRTSADKRVTAFNELVQNIKAIKFFAWEDQFKAKIDTLREKELADKWHNKVMEVSSRVLWFSSPFVTTLVTLGTYTTLAGKDLTSTVAFTALALFNLLRGPLEQFPETIVQLIDARISLNRIQEFLQESEIESETSQNSSTLHDHVLGFSGNARFSWEKTTRDADEKQSDIPGMAINMSNEQKGLRNLWGLIRSADLAGERSPLLKIESESDEETDANEVETMQKGSGVFQLKDINVDFPIGKLTVVLGPTGSGKSTLLLSLLTETHRLQGKIFRPQNLTTSYVPQTAWLQNASIRDNILFGSALYTDRYREVIRVCALERDFEVLEDGDLTEVGEKGINLSGGQKQRIALARACYSEAPVVILDDPLSAVDAPTAKFLMNECVLGFLARRTCILVTNAAHLVIPRSDHIIILSNGRILTQGSAESVLFDLSKNSSGSSFSVSAVTDGFIFEFQASIETLKADRRRFAESSSSTYSISTKNRELPKGVLATHKAKLLVEDENVEEGHSVDSSVYWMYLNAAGGWKFALVLVLAYSLNHTATIFLDYVVLLWCKAYEKLTSMPPGASTSSHPDTRHIKPMVLYGVVLVTCLALIVFRLLYLVYGMVVAGRNIHRKMMERLLEAPLSFFEVTPIGRIVNRFTKDISAIDGAVGGVAGNLVYNFVMIVFVLGFVSCVIPVLLIAMIPLGFVYYLIARYFIRTSLSLKRISSVTRSPIYSHFSETLSGTTLIRAFRSTSRFQNTCSTLMDAHTRPTLLSSLTFIWLALRVQMLSAVVVGLIGVFVLLGEVGRDWTGICLGAAGVTFTQGLFNLVWAGSILELNLNSVERCNEYFNLPQEEPIKPLTAPTPTWPSRGQITFDSVRLRYGPDLPEVLRGVTFRTDAREKIAIVGRTGAGKSSLALALFRMVQISGGRVLVDGVDLDGVSVGEIRKRITMVPQDPVLFEGTVRSNIDPFGTIPDVDLWAALKRVHLVHSTPQQGYMEANNDEETIHGEASVEKVITLDTTVSGGGSNFSMGQRQLLCLARALARRSRIIVMDEATASVDMETDSRIQETIRKEFKDSTVITIAHRLKTIMDYDRVIVMDAGKVVENNSPLNLLNSKSGPGVFRGM
ncbi:hypothetical protein HDU67_005724 [Dinochytrium kinnereticum]|nr:hypothetical protein HDU67_005724 [Dinochytrium kinnereticum]